jgi:hypothetical protein
MNRRRLVFLAIVAAGVVVGSSFAVVLLRPAASAPPASSWAYMVNWSCSNATSPGLAEQIGLVSGEYETRISVLNPSPSANVTLNGSFVESIARGGSPSNVIFKWRSEALSWTIEPGASLYMDCNTLSSLFHFSINDPFSIPTGFATLTAATPSLNVVATYTAQSFNATGVSTGISTEVQTITPTPVA